MQKIELAFACSNVLALSESVIASLNIAVYLNGYLNHQKNRLRTSPL